MNHDNEAVRSFKYDVVVVGARCAGASTAMLLARRGLRVLVVDKDRYGTDTLSTLALMRGGVLQLKHWGVLESVVSEGTPAVQKTSFHYADEEIEIQIKPRDGVDALYAPRRYVLDRLLVDAAREAGAEVVFGVRVVDLIRSGQRVAGVTLQTASGLTIRVEAGLVVGADGIRSTVARLAGAETKIPALHSTSVAYGFFEGLKNDGYHWYFRPEVSSGTIPTNDGRSCVFVSIPDDRYRKELGSHLGEGFRRLLKLSDEELADSVAGARLDGRLRGFSGVVGFMRTCSGPGWALVGDAGYFKDPLTAHGITDALKDAELLARAVLQDNLAEYQSNRDELSFPLFKVTDQIASFKWDLEDLQVLHKELSKEMNREVDHLVRLHEDSLFQKQSTTRADEVLRRGAA